MPYNKLAMLLDGKFNEQTIQDREDRITIYYKNKACLNYHEGSRRLSVHLQMRLHELLRVNGCDNCLISITLVQVFLGSNTQKANGSISYIPSVFWI